MKFLKPLLTYLLKPLLTKIFLKMTVFWIFALMMEAACASETSVNFYQTTRRKNPEDSHLHTRRRENLKCQNFSYFADHIVNKYNPMLSGSLVTTAWRVLRLRMEEKASRYGG
jgi:hypothetical protein